MVERVTALEETARATTVAHAGHARSLQAWYVQLPRLRPRSLPAICTWIASRDLWRTMLLDCMGRYRRSVERVAGVLEAAEKDRHVLSSMRVGLSRRRSFQDERERRLVDTEHKLDVRGQCVTHRATLRKQCGDPPCIRPLTLSRSIKPPFCCRARRRLARWGLAQMARRQAGSKRQLWLMLRHRDNPAQRGRRRLQNRRRHLQRQAVCSSCQTPLNHRMSAPRHPGQPQRRRPRRRSRLCPQAPTHRRRRHHCLHRHRCPRRCPWTSGHLSHLPAVPGCLQRRGHPVPRRRRLYRRPRRPRRKTERA